MRCNHKKYFRRFLAIIMLFCLLLQSMSGTITAQDESSARSDEDGMHFIVRHWHADGSSEDIEGYLWEDGSYDIKNGKVAEVTSASEGNPVSVRLNVKPNENETFTGFATAAGHEAVDRERNEEQPNNSYLIISYNKDIHLAKVHIFYKDTMRENIGDNTGTNETEIREEGKVYNTSEEGLHTDKTVAVAEGSDDGRTFDLTLESWFVNNNKANVGMVLDASGSMAFTSNDLEPIKMTEEQIEKYGKLQYIPQEEVNNILNPLYTDNSKLGYSGYTYFVYDPSDDTKEYVPIGYWNGVALDITPEEMGFPRKDNLIGYYSFDIITTRINELYIIKGTTADDDKKLFTVDEPTEDGRLNPLKYGTGTLPVLQTGTAFIGKGLDLARGYWTDTKVKKAVQLDVEPSDSFTVSFAVKGSSEKPLMWIGNPDQTEEKAWYAVYADTEAKQTKVVVGKDITTENIESGTIVQGNLTNAGFNICTYVFEKNGNNTTITIYANKKEIAKENVESINLNDAVIVIGGSAWQSDYSDNPLWHDGSETYLVDELYVYDEALYKEEVEQLYEAMYNWTIESAYAATIPSDDEKTMAELKNIDEDVINDENQVGAGWYYVSSNSNWSQIMNDKLLSSKSYRGIPKGEVIYNQINEVPEKINVDFSKGNTNKYINTSNFKSDENNNQAIKIGEAETWNGSIIFYIDSEGYLRCFYNTGNESESYCSYVYEKTDFQRVKTEALQYALGSFVTRLGEVSPDSMVSAVRFGTPNLVIDDDAETTKENLSKLVLLDWTNNTMESTGILGLRRGDRTAGAYESSSEDGEGINQYNYILTGGTATWTGLQSYIDNLRNREEGDTTASKHLIIFTDGKDTTGDSGMETAEGLAAQLKEDGYTIYCVMLQSAGNKIEDSREFLESLASDSNYVYEAEDVETLTEVYTTNILDKLVHNLSDYTVQDYIDPRFNLVTADNIVIYLNSGGSISVGEEPPININDTNGYEVTVMEAENSRDEVGEIAMLYYDREKDMYYLQWQKQTIPACSVNAKRLDIWRATIRVQAKDDFLGGNAILTNGYEENMNRVFHPDHKEGEPEDFPAQNFPYTAANVELLELEMYDGDDTIYKGEEICPEKIIDALGEKVDENAYYEYLKRYLAYKQNDYTECERIKSALANGCEFSIPYMYLPSLTGENQTGIKQQEDIIGTLTYKFEECEYDASNNLVQKTENPRYEVFITEDTNSRYYRLTITYNPLSEDAREEKNKNLTSSAAEYSKPYYWAGKTQGEKTKYGVHQTDIVSGELVFEAKVLLSDLLDMAEKNGGEPKFNVSFNVERIYGQHSEITTHDIEFSCITDNLSELEADENGYVSIFSNPLTGLPKGIYNVYLNDTSPLKFETIISINVEDGNGHFTDDYSGNESKYAAYKEDEPDYLSFYFGVIPGAYASDSDSDPDARLGHVLITYEPEIPETEKIMVSVDGIKHLSGRELKKDDFVFELIDDNIQLTATNESDGSFHFDLPITFSEEELINEKEKTYTYILKEQENQVEGITYDKREYLVQITLKKQDGTLKVDTGYFNVGGREPVEKAEFYNKYEDIESVDDGNPLGVATGDLANPLLLKTIMCISFLAIVITVFIRNKKNRDKEDLL